MTTPLRLFNSLTRQLEDFKPIHNNEARVYTCGPTVYNYPHIGNMRAYVFADTLGRVLSYKGYDLKHIINITDVGHLTDDADAGEDKLEKAAAASAKSIWDVAQHYTQAYWADIKALNIREPFKWSIATDYVPAMIVFAEKIATKHCYELESGLYFDTSTVADYGALARHKTEDGEGRIEAVDGKRHAADFAIWRKTPAGETRQMEWDSPWGKGAPGWHLECSVMSEALLGLPFDIHTGGIDHREIHHPNEIAQNMAFISTYGNRLFKRLIRPFEKLTNLFFPSKKQDVVGCDNHTGARFWMHNNFLIDRQKESGAAKMSKSSGEFLRLQLLIDKGFHPLAYRMMCLQAHYRSELEFSWDNLAAAFTRLKRLVMAVERARGNLVDDFKISDDQRDWTGVGKSDFDNAISEDLGTPKALGELEGIAFHSGLAPNLVVEITENFDSVLGLNLLTLNREDLRIRPKSATLTKEDVEDQLKARKAARAAKDFATSDRIRDTLIAAGVEVMDGDPLGWDWKLDI